MNKKMQYLIEYSLKKKFKSKSFIISNIVILLALVLLFNIDTVIKFFGGDFGKDINIYIVDNTNYVYDNYKDYINESFKNYNLTNDYVIKKDDRSLKELEDYIKEEESKDIIIDIEEDENVFKAEVISYEYVEGSVYDSITNALNTTKYKIALKNSNLDEKEFELINKNITIERKILNSNLSKEEELLKKLGMVIMPILILPFFMLILMVVSMIGSEINEEKTSRSMEIIISSVSPKIHFASKIISVNIFIIVQTLLLVLISVIAGISRILISGVPNINDVPVITNNMDIDSYLSLFLNSELLHTMLKGLPYIIIIFILSFVAYSLLAGILSSMTTSMDDYQQLQTPLTFILLAAYYIAMFSSFYDESIFVKVVSYIPFLSAVIAPSLIIMGEYSIIDISISIILLIGTIILLLRYGTRVYKVGILNYDSSNLWKKIFVSLKQK